MLEKREWKRLDIFKGDRRKLVDKFLFGLFVGVTGEFLRVSYGIKKCLIY